MTPPKVRIYELYKSLGLESSKDLITILESQFGMVIKSHSSTIDQPLVDKIKVYLKEHPPVSGSGLSDKKAVVAPVSKMVKAPVPPVDDFDDGRPRIDPSRVRVIKRVQPVAVPEVVVDAAADAATPVEPEKPIFVERKTPIVESKRYLLDPNATAPLPLPLTNTPVPNSPQQLKVGTIISSPDRERRPMHQQRPQVAGSAQVPGMAQAQPGALEAGARTSVIDQKPAAPGDPTSPDKKRGHFTERTWTAEKPFTPSAPRRPAAARKTRRQQQVERQEQVKKLRAEEEALLAAPKITSINEPMTISDLAKRLRLKDTELIKHLFMKGAMVTVNQTLEVESARIIAKEFEFVITEEEEELARSTAPKEMYESLGGEGGEKKKLDESLYKSLQSRSPVVSIMGHVDHGKTTLLDAIRETRHKIVDSEAGGITQSIGAYTVEKDGNRIVFLDTPGHEAFTAMRMRGARSTDIAILVVAADDGVMPQTIEAISHAKAAQIPIIIAVNKIDRENADPDKVLAQLTEYGLASEKWGGDTLTCEVSALQKVGLDEVLDNILLVSELLSLKADATVPAEGVIIEAQLDKRTGPVATALIQNGTIRIGDNILIGSVSGRVRALIDDMGHRIQSAGPSTPVEILGLNAVPKAGETFQVITDDRKFKQMSEERKLAEREERLSTTRKTTIGSGFAAALADGQVLNDLQFNLLIKADTQGSVEAVSALLRQMSTDEIKVNILHQGTGDINEADVMLASAGNAIIVGFNVREDNGAAALSKQQNVLIKSYDVIYHIAEDIEKMMLGKLSPDIEESEAGRAEVRQLFKIGKSSIAGCMVISGKMLRNSKSIVLREGEEVFTGVLDNLKRFKDDAKEVASGYECGISFDKFNDLREGDVVVVYTVKELERTSL